MGWLTTPHSSSASSPRNKVSKCPNLSNGHLETFEIKHLDTRVQRVQRHRWTRAEKVNDFNGVQVSSVSTPIGGSPPLDTAVTPRGPPWLVSSSTKRRRGDFLELGRSGRRFHCRPRSPPNLELSEMIPCIDEQPDLDLVAAYLADRKLSAERFPMWKRRLARPRISG